MANTIVYKEEYAVKMQEKLSEAKFWNTLGDAIYTDKQVFNNPYKNDPTVASYTRGAQFAYTDVTLTNETLDIVTSAISAEYIDRADLAQNGYDLQMRLAVDQGDELQDEIETAFFTLGLAGAGNASSWVLGSYIDGVADTRAKIVEDKGLRMLERKGGSIVMSPSAYALLVGEAQSAGVLTFAEDALKEGTVAKVGGFKIYESNLTGATTQAIGFVNKSITVGILNTTFGSTVVDEKNPDNRSAVGFTTRVDYGIKVFNVNTNMVVNVTIALV
tara:strand:+ start:2629 stop:3450 length:822 start_codon:yes stop_codon:yes gene_type:complete